MGFHMNFYRISMELTEFLNYDAFLKIVFIFAYSADPEEMLHYAAFHLGFHCLPKYLFTGIQNEKGPVAQLVASLIAQGS